MLDVQNLNSINKYGIRANKIQCNQIPAVSKVGLDRELYMAKQKNKSAPLHKSIAKVFDFRKSNDIHRDTKSIN